MIPISLEEAEEPHVLSYSLLLFGGGDINLSLLSSEVTDDYYVHASFFIIRWPSFSLSQLFCVCYSEHSAICT